MPAGHMTHTGVSGFAVDVFFFVVCFCAGSVDFVEAKKRDILSRTCDDIKVLFQRAFPFLMGFFFSLLSFPLVHHLPSSIPAPSLTSCPTPLESLRV